MATFVLTGATHVEDGVRYYKGSRIVSDRDLDQIFKGKFTRIDDAPSFPNDCSGVAETTEEEGQETREEVSSLAKPPSEAGPLGADVTSLFPSAAANELRVFKKGNRYHVCDAESDKPLTDKPIVKAAVESFIESYVGGGE